jgi:glycosyltransferase involved in cell wall biosynthesis
MRILYDGWPIIHAPDSPAALHLLALLESLSGEIEALVALPGEPPAWLPLQVVTHILPGKDTPAARLGWVQRALPGLAARLGADLLHLTAPAAPLFGRAGCVVSPCGLGGEAGSGLAARLGEALGYGGLARARAVLWPEDLPAPALPAALLRLPPLVHPAFWPDAPPAPPDDLAGLDLPETFILYHGSPAEAGSGALEQVLEAWSWVAGSLSEYYPLLLAGLGQAAKATLPKLLAGSRLAGSLRPLPPLSPAALAEVYRRCAALFQPLPGTPWGEPVRHALACGRPVVACDDPLTAALAGPAAYLASPGDGRALGAALISVVVEEALAEQLSAAARQRSAAWRGADFAEALVKLYYSVR